MISEHALLNVIPGQQQQFEQAFEQAQKIISSMPGYICHEVHQCIEQPNQYLLLVKWRNLEDHETGFRCSSQYLQWKKLLHHFYNPFPEVLHFELKSQLSASS